MLPPSAPLVAVAANKRIPGWTADRRDVPSAYQVMPLVAALEHEWHSDAHCVCYIATGPGQCQPRLRKLSVADWPGRVACAVLFSDIDNPAHAAWTDETLADAIAHYAALPILATAGYYFTRGGARIVQPLVEPVAVPAVEDVLRRWLTDLSAAGLAVDMACTDWTRLFRLPHVVRDGKLYRSPLVCVDHLQAITVPAPLAKEPPARAHTSQTRPARTATTSPRTPADRDGALFAAAQAAGWVGRKIDARKYVCRCPWESSHTTGATDDTSTVIYTDGAPCCLHAHCVDRSVAEWLDELPPHARDVYEAARKASGAAATTPTVEIPAAAPEDTVALDTVEERLDRMLAEAIDHAAEAAGRLDVIVVPPGAGKTREALRELIRRHGRGTLVAISHADLDRRALEGQKLGAEDFRHNYGVLSFPSAGGGTDPETGAPVPECHYAAALTAWQERGYFPRECACPHCERRDSCLAFSDAAVQTAADATDAAARKVPGKRPQRPADLVTHAQLPSLAKQGKLRTPLIVDELPKLLRTTSKQIDDVCSPLTAAYSREPLGAWVAARGDAARLVIEAARLLARDHEAAPHVRYPQRVHGRELLDYLVRAIPTAHAQLDLLEAHSDAATHGRAALEALARGLRIAHTVEPDAPPPLFVEMIDPGRCRPESYPLRRADDLLLALFDEALRDETASPTTTETPTAETAAAEPTPTTTDAATPEGAPASPADSTPATSPKANPPEPLRGTAALVAQDYGDRQRIKIEATTRTLDTWCDADGVYFSFVLLDASGMLSIDDLRVAAPHWTVRVWRLDVTETPGAVSRHHVKCSTLSRRQLLVTRSRLHPRGGPAVARVLDVVGERLERMGRTPATVGIVTHKPVAQMLRQCGAALVDHPAPELVEIITGDGGAAILSELRRQRALGRFANVTVLHYGAARGRNDLEDCGAVVLLGSPVPNVGAAQEQARAFGHEGEAVQRFVDRATAAEVLQALGRARAIRRTADRPVALFAAMPAAPAVWAGLEVESIGIAAGGPREAEAVLVARRIARGLLDFWGAASPGAVAWVVRAAAHPRLCAALRFAPPEVRGPITAIEEGALNSSCGPPNPSRAIPGVHVPVALADLRAAYALPPSTLKRAFGEELAVFPVCTVPVPWHAHRWHVREARPGAAAELVAVLAAAWRAVTVPADRADDFEELAGRYEYDAGMPRADAERRAAEDVARAHAAQAAVEEGTA